MDDDFYLVEPSKAELRQYRARVCIKCHVMKRPKQFRRPLTWAQARSRGYKGDRVMYIESTICRACSPTTFRPTEMSAKQIQDAAFNGRVSHARAKIWLEKKDNEKRTRAGSLAEQRWTKARRAPWEALIEHLRIESQRVRKPYDGAAGVLVHHQHLIRIALANARLRARRADKMPPHISWTDLVPADAHSAFLTALREAQAAGVQMTWKHPLILSKPGHLSQFNREPRSHTTKE